MKSLFWKWVTTRRAHDNPRGDFIRETQGIFDQYEESQAESMCESLIQGAGVCREARLEKERLFREWEKHD